MEKKINVCIGIQARSTSTRLPNKITEMIDNKPVIDHVIEACESASTFINRYTFSSNMVSTVFLLIPEGDPVKDVARISKDRIIEGDENDVLSRYYKMAKDNDAKFIVRVTADCPSLPHFLIYKCINTAAKNGFDYFSNVGDLQSMMRTSIDGHDVEVMSIRALDWVNDNAKGKDREHVTSLLRKDPFPSSLRAGILIGHNDHSHLKLSVDTKEDLERVRDEYDKIQKKISLARRLYGKTSVHRY